MKPNASLAALATVLALSVPAAATGKLTQLQFSTQQALSSYGYAEVDVRKLSNAQMAQIVYLATSDSGTGRIKGQIGAVLGDSVLKTLFN